MARAADRATIRVCEVTEFGGPEVLALAERPWPVAAPAEVVVRIAAANVNPTDIAARSGAHRRRMPELQPGFVPGWDLAGTVVEVGAEASGYAVGAQASGYAVGAEASGYAVGAQASGYAVGAEASGYAVGDRVVGMIPWVRIGGRVGAYAEAAAVEPGWLAPLPDGLDDVTAATVPLNALTARQALDLVAAPAGATVLVTGASGAVGGFATQLAVGDGLRVVAVASDGDEEWVAGLGAAEVVPRGTDLTDLAGLGPVDAVLDAVPIGPAAAAPVRAGGVAVFTRRVGEVPAELGELRIETPLVRSDPVALAELTREVASGRLRTRVARTLGLGDAAEAHRLVERGGLRGKVVLRIG